MDSILIRISLLLMILSMSVYSHDTYGQSGDKKVIINLSDSIKMIYARHLLPPINADDEEVVSFWYNCEDQPEYTLRITKGKENQHYLEGRFLIQRFDKILSSMRISDEGRFPIDVRLFSIPISETFTQNMRIAFFKTLECQKLNKVFNGPVAFDGICYNFRINNGNNELLKVALCEPEESNPCYKTIVLCKQMANDLKNQSFDESKYLN